MLAAVVAQLGDVPSVCLAPVAPAVLRKLVLFDLLYLLERSRTLTSSMAMITSVVPSPLNLESGACVSLKSSLLLPIFPSQSIILHCS